MSMIETAITRNLLERIMSKLGKIIVEGKKVPQLVRIIAEPSKFVFSSLKRASTTSNKFELDSPTVEIKNPLDRNTQVKEIAMLGDSGFKTNGIVVVFVGEVKVFESATAGDFTDATQGVNVPLINGKSIKALESVKILFKNDDDSTSISLAIQVTFGD